MLLKFLPKFTRPLHLFHISLASSKVLNGYFVLILEGMLMQRLAEGLYRITGPSRGVNTYLVVGDRVALIDPGLPGEVMRIRTELKRLPDLVLSTHVHLDHAGGFQHFEGQSVIGAHKLAARKLRQDDVEIRQCRASGSTNGGYRVHLSLEDGAELNLGGRTLRLVHTPGHTSGSTCFLEPDAGWLITGDTVFAHGKVSGTSRSGNVRTYRESLRRLIRLARMDPRLLCPGHGPVSRAPRETLEAARRELEARLESEAYDQDEGSSSSLHR